jgi:hypothetical protein
MGGLGKTTLAKKIYNNDHVKSHFSYRAWVNVSQDFNSIELLLEILQSQMLKPDRDELKKILEDCFAKIYKDNLRVFLSTHLYQVLAFGLQNFK